MAEQQIISSVASSSDSSFTASPKKYDVFLSFRGEDTRTNFTSHLHEALKQKGVETFIDDRLEKGDEISSALIKAIEDSHVSIVILSENYASSKWCLEELSKILECMKNQGQIVKPVFYQIDPSHVRKQTGSYEEAFAKHEAEGEPRCNKWKAALTQVANLAGWDSRNRTESELLRDIVGDILRKRTPRYPAQLKGIVGIEDIYEQIESLLKIGSSEVRIIGIWGMGGIGKTTIATAFYAKLYPEFEVGCFLAKVNENSSGHDGFEALRNKLFAKLLEDENHCFDAPCLVPDHVRRRLGSKKVFIVLDDVATSEQLEYLIKDYDMLGAGSRVIVTTRNKQIFSQVVEVYKVKELSCDHSLELFCLTVFGEKQPKHGYAELSRRAISYCNGIPLALKVVGASLRRRNKEAWESELKKLEKIPNAKIHDILKSSYDSLNDDSRRDVFLDIACFLKGDSRDRVIGVLDAFEFFPVSAIEDFLDTALITISKDNHIEMHDLIQQMGQEVVRQESIKYPGKRSRLWKHEEVLEVLKYNTGTDSVEGIALDLSKLTDDLYLESNSFTKMTKMRFLKIHNYRQRFNVHFPNGLKSLSDKLRYLYWDRFCPESLPSNFCAEQLVELRMRHSKIRKLWDGIQNLVNLKRMDLKGSGDLIEMPDLSKAEKLETICLNYCKEIERLDVHSKYISKLKLYGCASLKELSVTSEELTYLSLPDTNICAFSSIVSCKRKLICLRVGGCSDLDKLLDDLETRSITTPNHYGATQHNAWKLSSIQALFYKASHLLSLKRLFLFETNVGSLPTNIKFFPWLASLNLNGCRKLESLPKLPPSLGRLELNGCRELVSLPELPPSLVALELNSCKELVSLPQLPPSLVVLELNGCKELVSLPELPPTLWWVKLNSCRKLVSLSELPPTLWWVELNGCRELVSLPELPPSLGRLELTGCRELVSLPELPPSLGRLELNGCRELVSLPELPPSLVRLELNGCRKLVSLPELPPSPVWLELNGCRELMSLPKLPPSLCRLELNGCRELVSLQELPPPLVVLELNGCRELVSLPELPLSLGRLELNGCRELVSLPKLPPSLGRLELNGCRELVSLSELPSTLWSVKLNGCRKLVFLPELPPSLVVLELNGCKKLVLLPELPPSLEVLELNGCRKLVSLPELPPSLQSLMLNDCKKIVSLLELPPSLVVLELNGCKKLVFLPELPPSLEVLELNGCRKLVSLPELPPSLQLLMLNDCKTLKSQINGCRELKSQINESQRRGIGVEVGNSSYENEMEWQVLLPVITSSVFF